MEGLKKFGKAYNKFEEVVMVIFLAVMTGIVFVATVMRYVFNTGLTWSEESARFMFMWIIWISMSMGFRDKSHIRMTILPDRLPPKGKVILNIFINILILAFSIWMAYLGWKYVETVFGRNQTAPATHIPFGFVYACMPFALTVCCIRVILELIEDIHKLKTGDYNIESTSEAEMMAAEYLKLNETETTSSEGTVQEGVS